MEWSAILNWTSLVSLVMSVVAVVTAILAWRSSVQAVRARAFDQRFRVYTDVEEFLHAWMGASEPDMSLLPNLKGAWVRSQFLFGNTVVDYIRLVWTDAIESSRSRKIIDGAIEGNKNEAIDKMHELALKHVGDNFVTLREKFKKELRIKL